MAQPTMDLEPVIFAALTTFIAFGVITVAANALSNFAGTRLHDRKQNKFGDFEFFYDSDAAQDLRETLSRFPTSMMWLYFIFLVLVTVVGCFALSFLHSQNDITVLIVSIPITALTYITIIVYRTSKISRMLYRVFQDTQGT